ncbi:unnamed protein product [Rotaria magnacalcarata]|uniref:Insulin-like domain-containing protein n=2 Tax=Rotaria magnacalcarata TaxID=392030 RepID=A0A820G5U6_9BILA|nr:unnamed protein product [Rotaria magnacalcarata]CAF2019976.1 unnamed protein product [Rotaria magnacalcarata]CAF2047134.1 unnamed protein product [Rotaria magnacalcarata]CAF4201229.1 unnamed protein product [Rotaria magnacalcarata]CAF4273067.1 unnamed protein product [Rotaria magnacalcarata]
MMNNIIPLCFIALVAIIQTVSTIDNKNNMNDKSNNNNNNNNDDDDENIGFIIATNLQDNEYNNKGKFLRDIHQIIDGQSYRARADVVYHQRLRDGQCLVEYDGRFLTENSVIQIRKKLYRVENCLLERVFHACGPNLLLMLNIVCRAAEKHQKSTTTTATTAIAFVPNIQQKKMPPSTLFFHRKYSQLFRSPRVITESCCENLCTITELTRYCHR